MSLARHLQVMFAVAVLAAWAIAQGPNAGQPPAGDAAAPAAQPGDAPGDADAKSPLAIRQARVRQLVGDLRKKFDELAKSNAIEPEQRERIYAALAEAEKSGLESTIAEVVKSLNESEFTTAGKGQEKIVADIKVLIKILTEDKDERDEEMRRLEEQARQIRELIKEEKEQVRETNKVSEKDKTLNSLEAQIKAVEELIRREKEIVDRTAKARGAGIQQLGKVADEQRDVRGDTEKLAREVSGDGASSSAEPKPGGEGKPGEGKPGEGEAKPGEGEGKPGEGKPGGGKPGEGKPGEGSGKPGEGGEGGEGKPGEGGMGGEGGQSGGKSDSPTPDAPGQKPLEKAAEHQKTAEGNLGKGKGKAAEVDEQEAVAELERAKNELQKERDRIASLPPEAFENMAQKQDQTADKTGDLSKQMAKDAQAGGSQGGQGGEGGEGGESPPGQQKVQDAQKQMQQASGGLRRKEPKQASKKQEQAVRDLEQALDEIKKRLAQLRQEMQQERLAALEAHFRQMLEIQKPVTITTAAMDRIRLERQWRRPEIIAVGKLSQTERELSQMAQKGLDIIVEDGTSVVFPRVVEQLRDDLTSVANLIDAKTTGSYTQAMQREIEATLKELIEALEQAQRQNENSDQPPPSDSDPSEPPEPPLLPNSAELKLLKAAQLRVNRRTKSFDDIRPDGELEPVLREEVRRIAKQQDNVAEMTQAMVERN